MVVTVADETGATVRGPGKRTVRSRTAPVTALSVLALSLAGVAAHAPSAGTRPAEPPPPVTHQFLPDPWEDTWRPPVTGQQYRPQNRTVLIRLLNRERARQGCRPVRLDRTMTRAAQRHSDYMARAGVLSHSGPYTSGPGDRLTEEGYRWRRAAENLARSNAATALRLWKASPKHRAAMLTCAYRHAGVGVSSRRGQAWWTLVLAVPR